ncbi:hypothetical protein C8R43DRAFT_956098 [Mycena crocata]|nr:hypothetical protein C8R43DRAFT_956098 [Mycena crocata]
MPKLLLYSGDDRRWPAWQRHDSGPATPPSLDIYCARFEYHEVGDYLCLATGYSIEPYTGDIPAGSAIRTAMQLGRPNAPRINVFEAHSDNPLDAILHLPTTADMGAWRLDSLWHPYPAATFEGLTISCRMRMPVKFTQSRTKAWDIIQTNLQSGFWLDAQWSRDHNCTNDPSCPLSWRDTDDRGCLKLRLPTLPYTASGNDHIWNYAPRTIWNLGGETACTSSNFRSAYQFKTPRSYKDMDGKYRENLN